MQHVSCPISAPYSSLLPVDLHGTNYYTAEFVAAHGKYRVEQVQFMDAQD
jgi:hypothetical protein